MHIEAILFDLDDTLYPEIDYVISGFRFVSSILEAKKRIDAGAAFDEMLALFEEGARGNIFNQALTHFGCDYSAACIDELVQAYRDHPPDILLPRTTRLVLEQLRAARLRLGIITDGFAQAQRHKIGALMLDMVVDLIVYTDDWGRDFWKPNTFGYVAAARELSLEPASIVYVGDNPSKDFFGAKRIGMFTVQTNEWHPERHGETVDASYAADIEIDRLSELSSALGDFIRPQAS